MIYEIRTYTLIRGGTAEFEELFGRALPHREKYSKLTGLWHTDIGPLNQVIHIWPYDDLTHRDKARAEAAKDPAWPPKVSHLLQNMESEIMVPFPFMTPIEPGHYGNFYEMRVYAIKSGGMPEIIKRFGDMLPRRERHSKCLLAGSTNLGQLGKFIHIWPYEDMAERTRIRDEAVKSGDWPPNTGEFLLGQENKILVPAACSPAR